MTNNQNAESSASKLTKEQQKAVMILIAVLVLGLVLVVGIRQFTAGKRAQEKTARASERQAGRTDRTTTRVTGRQDRLFMRRAFRGRKGKALAREMYKQQQLSQAA